MNITEIILLLRLAAYDGPIAPHAHPAFKAMERLRSLGIATAKNETHPVGETATN